MAEIDKQESSDDEYRALADPIEDIAAHILDIESDVDDERPAWMIRVESMDNVSTFVAILRDQTVSHALLANILEPQRYSREFFYDVMGDTGCARASSGIIQHYEAHCLYVGQQVSIDPSGKVRCQFGIGGATSKRSFTIRLSDQ